MLYITHLGDSPGEIPPTPHQKDSSENFVLKINSVTIKVTIVHNSNGDLYFCSCGKPQNRGYPCVHLLYLAKHQHILSKTGSYDDRIKEMTHPTINQNNCRELHSKIGIIMPDPENIKNATNEIIPLNEMKAKKQKKGKEKESDDE